MRRSQFAEILGGQPHGEHAAAIIDAEETGEWTRQFVRASSGQGPVFIANPDWGEVERKQFREICRQQSSDWDPERGWLMIPTGGSSGEMKLARHDQTTVLAATNGAAQFFNVARIHSLGTLPRHHIGGLMAWLRSALTGGTYLDASWRRIAEGGFPRLSSESRVVSLVPTQLARLMEVEGSARWLREFYAVLIGGAALDERSANWARKEEIRLCPSYGATETAAMACALLPDEFLAGESGVGKALPHLTVDLSDGGELQWRGTSLFSGYWPHLRPSDAPWSSGDLGKVDGAGRIEIAGRSDGLIISGGEKINPAEVEALLRDILPQTNLKVLGVPHARWGKCVVLAHEGQNALDLDGLWSRAENRLAKFKWPKYAVPISDWPINSMGKTNHRVVAERVQAKLDLA
ncbi:MAG: AMP-binding protein [Synoicihabitans sp.]